MTDHTSDQNAGQQQSRPDVAAIRAHEKAHRDAATLDEAVLEGADDFDEEDIDPRKGMSDPALIRDIDSGKKTVNPYG